jgi:hypothetical protein
MIQIQLDLESPKTSKGTSYLRAVLARSLHHQSSHFSISFSFHHKLNPKEQTPQNTIDQDARRCPNQPLHLYHPH